MGFLIFLIATLFAIIPVSKSKCVIQRSTRLKYNGTLEQNEIIKLDQYSNNYNFTANFLLKYDPSIQNIIPGEKYHILNINNILKVYFMIYESVPKVFFHLLADFDEPEPIKFDILNEKNMHILVMRNKQINWGYHIFYASNSSSFRVNVNDKPATSFTKDSKLTIGGDIALSIKSFPGHIGPLFFSHVDIYEKIDANAYINLFHPALSILIHRFPPSETTNQKYMYNVYSKGGNSTDNS